MDSWRTQEATRQARRRDVNESTEDRGRTGGSRPGMHDFVCECGDPACTRTVCLSSPEYEMVRASPTHFVIAVNHENPEVECVVTESARFAVVETLVGQASKVALRTDPRPCYSGRTQASL